MADETPSPAELYRLIGQIREDQRNGFAAINARLDKLVSTELYSAGERRVDERLKDLADDIAAEREARKLAIKDEQDTREKAFTKFTTNLRWVAAAIVVPTVLFIANLLRGM